MPEVWRHSLLQSSQLPEADRWDLCALWIGQETEASGRPVGQRWDFSPGLWIPPLGALTPFATHLCLPASSPWLPSMNECALSARAFAGFRALS